MKKFILGTVVGFSLMLSITVLRDYKSFDIDEINMKDVVKIESTATGSLITLKNGEGYYFEN